MRSGLLTGQTDLGLAAVAAAYFYNFFVCQGPAYLFYVAADTDISQLRRRDIAPFIVVVSGGRAEFC